MLFITHAVPKDLQVDDVVRIGEGYVTPVGVVQAEGDHRRDCKTNSDEAKRAACKCYCRCRA